VRNHFLLPANNFHKDRIKSYVEWAIHPKNFNFIYGQPNAVGVCMEFGIIQCSAHINLQPQRQGFRSELILNVYAIHLKKVAGSVATYGDQFGALALCTAAVSVQHFTLQSLITSAFTRPSVLSHFGLPVTT
jgi:hypothetical protein